MLTLVKWMVLLYGLFAMCFASILDRNELIVEYMRLNNVNTLIYVTCPDQENGYEVYQTVKRFIDNGFTVGVYKSKSNTDFTITEHRHNLGILLNLDCPISDHILRKSDQNNYFSLSNFWMILSPSLEYAEDRLRNIFISPCSQVAIFHSDQKELMERSYLYKAAPNTPLRIESESKLLSNSAISRRKNLEGIYLRCGTVVVFPDVFTNIHDLKMRHIDTMARVNYPITKNLREDLNFLFNMIQVDNFGWRRPNGTFDGFMGNFQRNEVDFGNVALFMRLDRIPVVDFAGETVRFRACIMFRQPPLSAVTNIFLLPFAEEVWLSIIVFLVITMFAMFIIVIYSTRPINMNWLDCMNFALGAICQQGFYTDITNRAGRILIFSTFITSVFLFTSFSANIVALLQSPSETIRTLHDLTLSPLELGAQDTVYNKVYFKETTDPVTKFLYEKKISPKGETVFMRPEEGIKRMRKELFAYQVESQAAYKIISDTYSEPEKCGLQELEPFQLPPMSIPMRKNFPYKELFRQRLRWQREVGLIRREAIRWIPQRPKCESKMAGFISVSLTECRYTLQMLGVGMFFAFIVLLVEVIYSRFVRRAFFRT